MKEPNQLGFISSPAEFLHDFENHMIGRVLQWPQQGQTAVHKGQATSAFNPGSEYAWSCGTSPSEGQKPK